MPGTMPLALLYSLRENHIAPRAEKPTGRANGQGASEGWGGREDGQYCYVLLRGPLGMMAQEGNGLTSVPSGWTYVGGMRHHLLRFLVDG